MGPINVSANGKLDEHKSIDYNLLPLACTAVSLPHRKRHAFCHATFAKAFNAHPTPAPFLALHTIPIPPSLNLPSISLPRRLRAWTPTHTPLIPPPNLQPLLHTQL